MGVDMSRSMALVAARPSALAGALALVALSQPGEAAAASRGFKIYNLSSHALKLVDAAASFQDGDRGRLVPCDCWDGRPIDGATLRPGEAPHDWELLYAYSHHYHADLRYKMLAGTDGRDIPDGTVSIHLDVFSYENDSTCTVSVGTCAAEGRTITVLDPPG